ncbi:acetyltransferase [Colwellia sp. Bg11-28]|uniref:acetyltransferase n=1 Tax=Colwellia sp. Bg11-28 TaxID=2058305 RepID=UPI000C3366F7|nr:acetyltransferase [Colwellia sp. Bg11-28]PKH87607.1 acetyltransferase [Colwellia sp. Bg11-28]
MFLKNRNNCDIVDVENLCDLTNLFHYKVLGTYQVGEELQDPQEFNKMDLIFLSGEELPKCWTDPKYRKHEK